MLKGFLFRSIVGGKKMDGDLTTLPCRKIVGPRLIKNIKCKGQSSQTKKTSAGGKKKKGYWSKWTILIVYFS